MDLKFIRFSIKFAGIIGFSLYAMLSNAQESASLSSDAPSSNLTPTERRTRQTEIGEMVTETLRELYETTPHAKEEVEQAAGYAVFQATQFNAVFYVSGNGYGMVVDNQTGEKTFMQLVRTGTGPGLGYKNFRQVLVFKTKTLLNQFKTVGADVGASADATLKIKGIGGSVADTRSFNPDLSVYQITDQGVILQANWGSVTYMPDSALNSEIR